MEGGSTQVVGRRRITARHVYWSIPAFLGLVQLVFTLHSRSQLRYEELAESVRNVFWLEHHTIYDGISSNVGWYGALLLVYKIFGFSLHAAKVVRFALSCVSLVALAAVLARFFGARTASLPLLVVGLSPTLLYFNTLQAQFGIDLQYAPIVLYLVLSLDFSRTWTDAGRQLLLGAVAMIGCMSYPAFAFYLPTLALLYGYGLRQASGFSTSRRVTRSLLLSGCGFVLPLLLAIAFLKQPQLLLLDPVQNSGIFRGGAGALSGSFSAANVVTGVRVATRDMFYRSGSYYFELASVDFSNYYPVVAIGFVLVTSVAFMAWSRTARLAFLAAWTLLLCTAIVAHVSLSGNPGMRRSTGMLAAIYALLALGWHQVCHGHPLARRLKPAMAVCVALILFHHVTVLQTNYSNLPTRSPYQYNASPFFRTARTPLESLTTYVQEARSGDLMLRCPDGTMECRYAEIYAAVAGSCLWNGLRCHQIFGYDERAEQFIPLSIELWETYYWKH